MSIETNKLVNLGDAQILYNDLRGRVGNVAGAVAPDYADLTFPVSTNQLCWHEGGLYAANQEILTTEDWTAAHWIATSVDELQSALNESIVLTQTDIADLQKNKAPIIIDTVSGSVASFPDGADGLPVQNLVVGIEPVQDLHGYDAPWAPGAGQNILDPNIKWTEGEYYGIDFIVTKNGYEGRRSGTATSSGNIVTNAIALADAIILPAGTYTSKGAIFALYDTNGSWIVNKYSGTWTIDQDFYVRNLYIQVVSGTQYSESAQFIALTKGSTAPTSWTPYSNICPISGWTGCNVTHAPTTDPVDPDKETYSISWQTEAGTVYGGNYNVTTGLLTVTHGQIASYNGETLPGEWISDRDVYAEWTTPTAGAQVVYTLAEPITYQLSDMPVITTLLGINNIWADTGNVSVSYRADTELFVRKSVPVQDVQVNGTSVLSQGVANVPVATTTEFGTVKYSNSNGVVLGSGGLLTLNKGNDNIIKAGTNSELAVRVEKQHLATFYALAKLAGADMASLSSVTVGQYPEAQKSAISTMLNGAVSVSGTTPSITGLAGLRYVCGECATLTIVAPASGCIDVTFTSGSTATVLTVSSAKTGVTAIKWANGFDPTSLDANTTYEVNILDGEFGVVGSWT